MVATRRLTRTRSDRLAATRRRGCLPLAVTRLRTDPKAQAGGQRAGVLIRVRVSCLCYLNAPVERAAHQVQRLSTRRCPPRTHSGSLPCAALMLGADYDLGSHFLFLFSLLYILILTPYVCLGLYSQSFFLFWDAHRQDKMLSHNCLQLHAAASSSCPLVSNPDSP